MRRNELSTSTALESVKPTQTLNSDDTEIKMETKSEYKIGHTTYTVVTKFNTCGESLNDILARLIKKDIEAIA